MVAWPWVIGSPSWLGPPMFIAPQRESVPEDLRIQPLPYPLSRDLHVTEVMVHSLLYRFHQPLSRVIPMTRPWTVYYHSDPETYAGL